VFSATPIGGGMPSRGPRPLELEIRIAPGTPAGTYSLDLSIVWDGIATPDVLPVVVH
jgi:uncharacterized membrane protein